MPHIALIPNSWYCAIFIIAAAARLIESLHLILVSYTHLAPDISVPSTERIVYIVLRERTQQIMESRIGSLKNLLMQAAAELWYCLLYTSR